MSLSARDRALIDLHDVTFDTALAEGLPLAEAQARALQAVTTRYGRPDLHRNVENVRTILDGTEWSDTTWRRNLDAASRALAPLYLPDAQAPDLVRLRTEVDYDLATPGSTIGSVNAG